MNDLSDLDKWLPMDTAFAEIMANADRVLVSPTQFAFLDALIMLSGRDRRRIKRECRKAVAKARLTARNIHTHGGTTT